LLNLWCMFRAYGPVSVCLSIRPSHSGIVSKPVNGPSSYFAQKQPLGRWRTLHWTGRGFGCIQKWRYFLLELFPKTLDFRKKFTTARRHIQALPTKVDAHCDKLATVVGRQFITLSVHLFGRNVARRAGLSSAAETCYNYHYALCKMSRSRTSLSSVRSTHTYHGPALRPILSAAWITYITAASASLPPTATNHVIL